MDWATLAGACADVFSGSLVVIVSADGTEEECVAWIAAVGCAAYVRTLL